MATAASAVRSKALSLVSMWAVERLARFMQKRLPADHPVLRTLGFRRRQLVDVALLRAALVAVIARFARHLLQRRVGRS